MRDKASDAVSHRAIARDITARKRAETALINARERAEFASQAKSRFLATVSHEIRTPMNGIMGMAKLLADTSLSPEQRTYVGAISTSASALLALIEDLLDYSKIEAGRFELEPQPVSMREIADSIVELLAARAYAKGIGIGCHVAPDVPLDRHGRSGPAAPGAAQSDRQRHQVHRQRRRAGRGARMPAPSQRRPSASPSPTPARASRQRDLDRIFEEFEQADGTSTRKHGGAGLGLAISRRIVTSMGGTIGVASEPGVGSKFHFEIPASGAKQAPKAARPRLPAGASSSCRRTRSRPRRSPARSPPTAARRDIVATVAQAALACRRLRHAARRRRARGRRGAGC